MLQCCWPATENVLDIKTGKLKRTCQIQVLQCCWPATDYAHQSEQCTNSELLFNPSAVDVRPSKLTAMTMFVATVVFVLSGESTTTLGAPTTTVRTLRGLKKLPWRRMYWLRWSWWLWWNKIPRCHWRSTTFTISRRFGGWRCRWGQLDTTTRGQFKYNPQKCSEQLDQSVTTNGMRIHGNYQKFFKWPILPTPKLEHKMPTHVGMTKCPHKQLHVASIITDIQIYTSVYKNMETLPNNEDIFLYNLRKQTLNTSRCLNKLTRNVVSLFFFLLQRPSHQMWHGNVNNQKGLVTASTTRLHVNVDVAGQQHPD